MCVIAWLCGCVCVCLFVWLYDCALAYLVGRSASSLFVCRCVFLFVCVSDGRFVPFSGLFSCLFGLVVDFDLCLLVAVYACSCVCV